jgi:hypothetical protein
MEGERRECRRKNAKTRTSAGARRNFGDDEVTPETVFNYWDLWSSRADYTRREGMEWHRDGSERLSLGGGGGRGAGGAGVLCIGGRVRRMMKGFMRGL